MKIICDRCNQQYDDGIQIVNSYNITLNNVYSKCPHCGSVNKGLSGTFNFDKFGFATEIAQADINITSINILKAVLEDSKDKNISIKFVYYFLKINEIYFQNIGGRMQMPQISIPDTDKFKIPVPSLAEQERIVSILDKFDTLTTSITEGLPKEIELRKKQYEYYRDMLLSFPKN